MPPLINAWQRTDFPFTVMIRTGVLYQGTPGDIRVIYGGLRHGQMVGMVQDPMYQFVSWDTQRSSYVG